MYNPSSVHADDFIDHGEILETLDEAARESRNHARVEQILEKARLYKGLSHRESRRLQNLYRRLYHRR